MNLKSTGRYIWTDCSTPSISLAAHKISQLPTGKTSIGTDLVCHREISTILLVEEAKFSSDGYPLVHTANQTGRNRWGLVVSLVTPGNMRNGAGQHFHRHASNAHCRAWLHAEEFQKFQKIFFDKQSSVYNRNNPCAQFEINLFWIFRKVRSILQGLRGRQILSFLRLCEIVVSTAPYLASET